MARLVPDHIFQSNHKTLILKGISLFGALGVVLSGLKFGFQDGFKHLVIGRCLGDRRNQRGRFAAERHDLVRQELGMQLLIGNFFKEERRKLRPEWTRGFGGVVMYWMIALNSLARSSFKCLIRVSLSILRSFPVIVNR